MVLDFTPECGDRVTVFGYNGDFVVKDRNIADDGQWRFRLASAFSGEELDDIGYAKLTYSDGEKVRKVLRQILPASKPWPADLILSPDTGLPKYEIHFDEMRDGTPTVIVIFLAKPETVPSFAGASKRIEFYNRLRQKLLMVSLEAWVQFTTKEERSVLSAAS